MLFLIDENIQKEIGDFLESSGYNIMLVPKGITNGQVSRLALKEKRILLTHDKHFSNILQYPPQDFCGIIRIHIHPPIVSDIITSLNNLFQELTQEKMDKHLIVLEKEGFRCYPRLKK